MTLKLRLRLEAIELRKFGKTYSEILSKIPVAKSTLAEWFKEVSLSTSQKQRITQKRLDAALRGALSKKNNRILLTKTITEAAKKEIGRLSARELWLIGVVLYWAEGSKEKEYHPGSGVKFMNSDPLMIKLFLKWLKEICHVDFQEITLEIYLHDNNKHRVSEVKKFWEDVTEITDPLSYKLYFKSDKIRTKRKNIGESYYGILCVRVKRSSTLLRKITGWTSGIYCGIV